MSHIKTLLRKTTAACVLAGVAATSAQAELPTRSFCIFDPIGANGPLFNVMKSAKPAALKWGVALELKAYTDEKIAAEDFKAGQCDSVLLTGTRAREFNKFTGTLEAMGAIKTDEQMKMVLDTLASPKAAKLMRSGEYEVAGILPAGAIYLFTRDRSIDTVEEMQGKKVATLDYDEASLTMVRKVGASVVGASSANFAGKFNNGSVDIAYAPAVAYTPLELYKGTQPNGGVFNYKIAQMNFQIIIRPDRFPEGYGQKVREYAASRYEEAYDIIRKAEAEIKPSEWINPDPEKVAGYDKLLREVRIALRDKGVYDAKALRLMRKVRCKSNPTAAECTQALE
ncbi:putative solute-binding protein [Hahella sp. SMD15-11]|uniref:Solute-binding protein n=1 Tax=Thermohahella caldifontis TaxID=3142973 RepID=A0AB39UTX3_9GAMM